MKKLVLVALIAGMPLAAQNWELGVFAGMQSYNGSSTPSGEFKAKDQSAFGAHLGYSIVDLGPAMLQLTAGYQPKTEATFQVNGNNTGEQYKHEHASLGVMFNFKAFLAFGVGAEYRMEKVNITHSGLNDATYNRPWLRANLGIAFPTPVVKPFIGVEVAAPFSSKSFDVSASPEENLKAYAPKLQAGIYAGIRF